MRPVRPESATRSLGRVSKRTGALARRDAGGGGSSAFEEMFTSPNVLATFTGDAIWTARFGGTITEVHLKVGTSPTGSGVTVVLNKNGSSVGTATIAAAGSTATFVPSPDTFVVDDEFTFDVTLVGSTIPGSNLVMQISGTRS